MAGTKCLFYFFALQLIFLEHLFLTCCYLQWLNSLLLCEQTQEREAKAEMKRKAKELQQARRDAERSGIKAPSYGGFGGASTARSAAVIKDTFEPERPKVAPAPIRYYKICSLFYLSMTVF